MPAQGRMPMQWLPISAPTVYISALSRNSSLKHTPGPFSRSWEATLPSRKLLPSVTPSSTAFRLWAYSSITRLSSSSRGSPVLISFSTRTTSTTRVLCSFASAMVSPMVRGIFALTALLKSDISSPAFSSYLTTRPVE